MSHPRTGRALIAALAASTLVATACAGGTPSASSGPGASASASAAASEKPQQGGRIIEGTISDIATMQPVLVNDTASGRITGLLYDTLIQQDPKSGEVKPRMASYTTSQDGLTYTFTINDKANWSDGKPITGQDWLTAVTAVAKSAKTVRKSNFQDVQGFNDFKDGKYLTATSKPEDFDNAPENTNPQVVSGPFLFKEWRKSDQVILGKNDKYWQ